MIPVEIQPQVRGQCFLSVNGKNGREKLPFSLQPLA
jgi:hypothetical protein